MIRLTDFPLIVFALTFALMWLGTWVGALLRSRWHGLSDTVREDYGVTLGATLTLLGLIIGFTFSMATTRYEQRKNYEEEEANAIGTEYVRVELLPTDIATRAQSLLIQYTNLRIEYYRTRSPDELRMINGETARLQDQMWEAIAVPARSQPTSNTMLVASGMNDVLNAQGYTQAAWWNRIPRAAWFLMFAIAIVSHILLGYGAHRKATFISIVLPLLIAISFLLIADIDSPRGGIIRVQPQNLEALAQQLQSHR
jgi:hypothetical protein